MAIVPRHQIFKINKFACVWSLISYNQKPWPFYLVFISLLNNPWFFFQFRITCSIIDPKNFSTNLHVLTVGLISTDMFHLCKFIFFRPSTPRLDPSTAIPPRTARLQPRLIRLAQLHRTPTAPRIIRRTRQNHAQHPLQLHAQRMLASVLRHHCPWWVDARVRRVLHHHDARRVARVLRLW